MSTSTSSLTSFISDYVKADRKLLLNSVVELTKNLSKILSAEDHECIKLEQNNPQFWCKENLCNFYDFYLNLWNENRVSKLN
ncbi:hypothetical protein SAMN05421796_11420 [Chryseobacterium piscicola]|uniref:Uncharacterized protein n=1 Tax=Chryseobacterium piscicola TaxID=551459 RepID=A0A1N7PG34_9FLAO|nr:hypothetical protein [Chryseobacterium piscicola]PQA92071.1 hypothetical protein B0A70_11625 [Chryseobacterium piscicola]SIT09605.1 hypothetical protein SAMN05421796_11420 [Chryseobacterium piscicola]